MPDDAKPCALEMAGSADTEVTATARARIKPDGFADDEGDLFRCEAARVIVVGQRAQCRVLPPLPTNRTAPDPSGRTSRFSRAANSTTPVSVRQSARVRCQSEGMRPV
jgi:hypothetical protein